MARVRAQTRWQMAGRIAAIPFSYVLASLAAACVARFLPIARVEAAATGMMLLFAICAVLVMWAFSARSVARLWLWFALSTAVLATLLALSIRASGRA